MLKIIVAIAENGVIGRDGDLPFDLPEDRFYFKEVTWGQVIVQGRKTFDSIVKRLHKPLPGRENIVLTRHPTEMRCDGVRFISDFAEIVELAKTRDVLVIGGTEVYALALPFAEELLITRVHASVEGDVRFPEWQENDWEEVFSNKPVYRADRFDFTWKVYKRRLK